MATPEPSDRAPPSSPPLSSHDPPRAGSPDTREQEDSLASLPPIPKHGREALEDSSFPPPTSDAADYTDRPVNQTVVLEEKEKEMRRKLMDMESSFVPEPSAIQVPVGPGAGADDTYLVGVPKPRTDDPYSMEGDSQDRPEESVLSLPKVTVQNEEGDVETSIEHHDQYYDDTSAVAENVSRSASPSNENRHGYDDGMTPRPSRHHLAPDDRSVKSSSEKDAASIADDNDDNRSRTSATSERRRIRPKYLTSRQSSYRFSTSSQASTTSDGTEATVGADFALQSGGAVPVNPSSSSRKPLVRSISLGSVASGVSGYSEENVLDKRVVSGTTDGGLQTLDEEDAGSPSPKKENQDNNPSTPKRGQEDAAPPGTAGGSHDQNTEPPGTFARQFHEKFSRSFSPEKRDGLPTPGFSRIGKSMTLKEQSSTIDRLSKENFDLKMRIHFLNEALNKRSEEGIKEMISENVELKSDKLKLQKENQNLKRKIKKLESQLKDRQSDGESAADADKAHEELEEELNFLRERVESYEAEIERLRSESIVRETEKRRLAEIVKALGDGRQIGSDSGAREERDMWKDMLDAETAAREQAEEENRRLRDEILRLKVDAASALSDPVRYGRGAGRKDSMVSYPTSADDHRIAAHSSNSATLVELELLRKENAELRREVSAQTSMLTSRNREKERLYQEIEDLKLQRRGEGGGRSVTGDSIFERSASRAHGRSSSRASDGTRASRASDTERETLEIRNGELRDQVSSLKLENQGIRAQLEECIAELEELDKAYQADVDQAEEEIQALQHERDQALQYAEEREAALQELKAEAQEEIDALGDELDQKIAECQRLEAEQRQQAENLRALQAELRSASEGINRLEEDAQTNLRKYKAVQQELDDANREIASLEKSLFEANNKVQRLTVQLESSQNEISFLREEQDADKIRISDLESELKNTQVGLQIEREHVRELENRLAEERQQRELVATEGEQKVQRVMNELNQEVSMAKEEIRKLKKALAQRETEAKNWKDRLMELENGLREALGDLNGTRSSMLASITKLQKELERTSLELESTRAKLDEKETLLQSREALLESHGLESRKLSELLDRERQARRADKHSFEQALKSQQQASRTLSANNSRITDLENKHSQERRRFATVEQQLRDQLNERNTLFLTLWKRLSALCGPDWAHSNSLINGNLPSVEVIGNILFWPGFSRNLLLAVKTIEGVISGFKTRIKTVENSLNKEYQTLEHKLETRMRRLDRLEEAVRNLRSQQRAAGASPEIAKLRGENRLLKAELNLMRSGAGHSRSNSGTNHALNSGDPASPGGQGQPTSLVQRKHARQSSIPQPVHSPRASISSINQPNSQPTANEQIWLERLRELEARLKSEREARMADRNGARRRLQERDAENEQLRAELERERMRREAEEKKNNSRHHRSKDNNTTSSSGRQARRRAVVERATTDQRSESGSSGNISTDESEYEEGITVDIEV